MAGTIPPGSRIAMATGGSRRGLRQKNRKVLLKLGLACGFAVAVATTALVTSTRTAPGRRVAVDDTAGRITALQELHTEQEMPFDPVILRNRYSLLYFGFTHCPDACPTALFSLASALKELGPAGPGLQPVFVTVDPSRDTPAVLKEYLGYFHPDIIGLTGSPEAIKRVESAFGIEAMAASDARSPNDYSVDHTNEFLLLSPTGTLLRRIPASTPPGRLIEILKSSVPRP